MDAHALPNIILIKKHLASLITSQTAVGRRGLKREKRVNEKVRGWPIHQAAHQCSLVYLFLASNHINTSPFTTSLLVPPTPLSPYLSNSTVASSISLCHVPPSCPHLSRYIASSQLILPITPVPPQNKGHILRGPSFSLPRCRGLPGLGNA